MLKKGKMKWISIFATAFLALTACAIGFGKPTAKASAQSSGVFQMENGASLRISEGGGLRFRVKMDETQMKYVTENDDVSLHFLVAPHEFYNAVAEEDGVRDYYNGLAKKKVVDVDESKIYAEDGYYWANGCVTNILGVNRYLDYTLLAYTYDASTSTIEYASVERSLSDVRGSLMDVLSQAVVYSDSEETSYTDSILNCEAYSWFGTKDYPIQISNAQMYEALVEKVESGEIPTANTTINVSDTVEQTSQKIDAQTSYTVKFYNEDNTLYKKYILWGNETLSVPKAPSKASAEGEEYDFIGWDADGDGIADSVGTNVSKSVSYTAIYSNSDTSAVEYIVTFDNQGGMGASSATVAHGTSFSEFYKPQYIPADSGYIFDSWLYNGEKVDKNATVTSNMDLVAYYKRVDGTAVAESPVNGDFYQAFVALPTDYEVGTSVLVEMDIFVTGKLVSQNVDTSNGYYNEWATSAIRWVDTVYSAGGEVNAKPVAVSFEEMVENQGAWMTVSFEAKVRNFPVLKDGTGWADVEMGDGNAVYLFAYKFKSAASFNYRNVKISTEGVMPNGTQKNTPDKYYQSFVGLSTDLPSGTFVKVAMDIRVSGSIDSYSYIRWVDTVWTTSGGEVNNAPTIVDYAAMSANQDKWIRVEFYATVRDFDVLRLNTGYPTMDVSETGTGVFLVAESFLSSNTFIYKNVVISADEADVGTAMPEGAKKTNNADNYYQSFVGLSTDLPEGSYVQVEMDVYVTGTYDQYTQGIKWVDTVWTTSGGEVNNSPTIVDYATISANAGNWIHVTFNATVRDFVVLRLNGNYTTMDTSAYGTAVYLVAHSFTSAESFNYKNVTITSAVPLGVEKTSGNAKQYRQAFVGLPVDAPVGTAMTVEMDIYITGTYDQYTQGIKWVDTVWTTSGGEVNAATTIVDYATISANAGQWIHVAFEATVRNFAVLRLNDQEYATMDTSAYGTAVYLVAHSFTSAESFIYKNVTMKATFSAPDGTEKTANANGYHQAFVGLSTDLEAGTAVKVKMEIYVTGTADNNSSIKWVDTVYSVAGGEVNNAPTIVDYATMSANAGQWISVEFDAIVKDYDVLRMNSAYATVDVSLYGNAVFLMAKNFKSDASFNYRNVVITEA